MKLIEVLKNPKYGLLALVSSTVLFWTYVYAQNLGVVENMLFWFTITPWYNLILLIIFTTSFGFLLAYQTYVWRHPSCSISSKAKSGILGGGATFTGFLVAQCPSCLSFTTLVLPLGVAHIFIQYNWAITSASIILMLFSLHHLGAFRK